MCTSIQATLDTYAALCLVKLAMRLVNDESVKCRRLVTLAVRKLLEKVSDDVREQLFRLVDDWLLTEKVSQ